jgi:hypothetical protein
VDRPWKCLGVYAYDARHPDDDNPAHYYQCLVMEETVDRPEAEHRFYSTWIDSDTDQDEYLGQDLPLEQAMQLAEQHAARKLTAETLASVAADLEAVVEGLTDFATEPGISAETDAAMKTATTHARAGLEVLYLTIDRELAVARPDGEPVTREDLLNFTATIRPTKTTTRNPGRSPTRWAAPLGIPAQQRKQHHGHQGITKGR